MSILTLSLLLVLHFIADFVLQSDHVAKNKSKDNKILLYHVSIYSLPFMLLISPLYGLINGMIHFCVDYFTSRLTSKLWDSGKTHLFFVTIGFDQLLHILTLVWTYNLLF